MASEASAGAWATMPNKGGTGNFWNFLSSFAAWEMHLHAACHLQAADGKGQAKRLYSMKRMLSRALRRAPGWHGCGAVIYFAQLDFDTARLRHANWTAACTDVISAIYPASWGKDGAEPEAGTWTAHSKARRSKQESLLGCRSKEMKIREKKKERTSVDHDPGTEPLKLQCAPGQQCCAVDF